MKFDVLDHGYVRFVEAWGTGDAGLRFGVPEDFECGIVEAARQSTQGSFRGWEKDAKLLEHLYSHKHSTPFEFAGMVLEVQAPIMVFREWHRHRTQSYNEMSARYAALPDLYYVPDLERVMLANSATTNKQAQNATGQVLDEDDAKLWLNELIAAYDVVERCYQRGLRIGIPKEIARLPMSVGHYTRMRCSANLRNWLAFLTLRMDPAAQLEIREYAGAVAGIISDRFPQTYRLFGEYR